MKLIDLLVKELPKSGGWPSEAVTAIYFSHKQGVTFYDKDGMGIKNGVSFICMDIHGVRREEVTKEEFEAALDKNDGWIKVMPGEYPVNISTVIDVKFDDGSIIYGMAIKGSKWHGATHYRIHRDINTRANDDRLEQGLNGGLIGPFNNIEECIAYADKEREQDLNECIGQDMDPAWNGKGLPPVGVECEWQDKNTKQWIQVLVVYASEWVTVIRENKKVDPVELAIENYGDDACLKFRPLRTEAERLREKSIKEIDAACRECPHQEALAEHIYEYIAAGKFTGIKLEEK